MSNSPNFLNFIRHLHSMRIAAGKNFFLTFFFVGFHVKTNSILYIWEKWFSKVSRSSRPSKRTSSLCRKKTKCRGVYSVSPSHFTILFRRRRPSHICLRGLHTVYDLLFYAGLLRARYVSNNSLIFPMWYVLTAAFFWDDVYPSFMNIWNFLFTCILL